MQLWRNNSKAGKYPDITNINQRFAATKSFLMKNLLIIILCCVPGLLVAQDTESYTMFQTVQLKVNPAKAQEFRVGMTAHNKKYHSEGAYTAGVWSITTGPDAGKLVWMMGPCTFSDLDDRPDMEAHGKDWRENVLVHTTESGNVEYWKRRDDVSKPSTGTTFPMVRVRYMVVEKGQGYRIKELLTKLKETIMSLDRNFSFEIYVNEFLQGSRGRHYAAVTGFNKWGELDENWEFVKAFEKIHGVNTYRNWIREMNEVFSDRYDEFWRFIPEFSGAGN